jgi:hypothetical protein
MVWRLFATKLETAETREGVALNMRANDLLEEAIEDLLIKYAKQEKKAKK